MFRELCGDAALKNVVLVTNMWSEVSSEVGEDRERQLSNKFFRPVLELGVQMVRHHNTAQSAHDIIRRMLANDPVVLQIQRELVDEHKDIADTAAGRAVNQELNELMRRNQAELKEVQEEIERALKEKDEQTMQELEEGRKKLKEELEKAKKDSEGMASNYAAEKERTEVKLKELEQEERRERTRFEATYRRQSIGLNPRPPEVANTFAAHRPRLGQETEKRRYRLDDSNDNGFVTVPLNK